MAKFTICGFIFVITLSEVVINTQLFIHGNSHGYIPANNEVRYIVDELPLHKEFSSGGAVRISNFEEDVYVSSPHLRLNPRVLDFKDRHLGVPHHEKVTVFNTNDNKTIQLTSISGNTVHFHSSFFEDKVIPPLGNTSFSVVFLGREEGTIESTLFIHTSEGSIKYPVKGNSISSPYRLRPLIGVHMPMNASFAPLIHMHNPHPKPIQIVEIFSSGGELSLELPTGELEASKNLWEIRPFETKAVIRARLYAQTHRNHTCYVRIRVNGSDEHLVIPLEVEVGSSAGLYPPDPSLDLGVMGSLSPPTRLSLRLHNSGKKSTLIQNVFTVPANKAIKIDFRSIKVPPDSNVPTEVAVIKYDPKIAFEEKHFSGKIVVKGKNRLVIPYHARVLQGGLKFSSSIARFCTDTAPSNIKPRNFVVKNKFLSPLVVGNITLAPEAEKYFLIRRFNAVVIPPEEEIVLFELAPNVSSFPRNLHLESYIQIVTNVSVVTAPLLCYDGHVVKVVPPRDRASDDEQTIEAGLLGVGNERDIEFALLNLNPVEVPYESWGVEPILLSEQLVQVWVELLGSAPGGKQQILQRWEESTSNLTQTMAIQSQHYAIFKIGLTATTMEGYTTIQVFVKTKYEKILIPVKVHVAKGNIRVDRESLVFTNCFPGRVARLPLEVQSTFQKSMRLTALTNLQTDSNLVFKKTTVKSIKPFATTNLGEVYYDPRISCKDHCYIGIDQKSPVGQQWMKNMALPSNVWEQDATLLSTMYMWFLSTIASPRTWFNYTMRLDTNEVRGYIVPVATRLVWPIIVQTRPYKHIIFPLSQVGNTTTTAVHIVNPSDTSLIVQAALGPAYSPGHSALGALPVMLHPPLHEGREGSPREFMIDGIQMPHSTQKQFVDRNDGLDELLGAKTGENSVSVLIRPKSNYTVFLHYRPYTADPATTLLFIRNNLTVLEVLRVSGQGAQAQFRFGNRKPGASTPLQFDLSEKHLRDCLRKEYRGRRHILPLITEKRSFTARNSGELPIYISSFLINDLPCEGFGFKVLNCKPFLLTANSSRKIDIAFTADFTLARVQRILKIMTSMGPGEAGAVNYSLVATLPVSLLSPCMEALPRPPWEQKFYYSLILIMVLVFIGAVGTALIESNRIHKCSVIVAAAAAGVSLSRPSTPKISTASAAASISQSHNTNQQNHNNIHQNKNESMERNKRELNISTNNRTTHNNNNMDSSSHNHNNNNNHQNNNKEKSHSPDDSPDDDKSHENNRNSNGSASPQPQSSNSNHNTHHNHNSSRSGTKRKLSKKHSAGNSDSCDSHSNSHQHESSPSWNNPSPSPSNQSTKSESNSRKTVWSGVFVRSNGKASPNKSSVNLEVEETRVDTKETPPPPTTSKRSQCNQGKSNRKNRQVVCEPIPAQEEDNSSTTTESSNNEEMEKEGHVVQSCKAGREARDSYEGDGEEEDEEPCQRRSGSKASKQTKGALEQPAETTVSTSSHSNKQSSNSFVALRQQSQPQETHKSSRQTKQNSRDKNTVRTQPSTKRKPPQERERSTFRVSESETPVTKPVCVVNWEPPPPAPAQENTDSGPSPLLYSKIVAPVPESPPPVTPVLTLPVSTVETASSSRKKEVPGPIGPKPPPKRVVPPMPLHSNWDFPAEPRMNYTSGINAAPGANTMVGAVSTALDTPASLLQMYAEPSSSLLADNGVPGWDPQAMSVMKVLQEQRRRRVELHQQRLYQESKWGCFEPWDSQPPVYCPTVQSPPAGNTPQFNVPPPSTIESGAGDNLWDNGQQWGGAAWLGASPLASPQETVAQVQQQQQQQQPPPQPEMPLQNSSRFDLFGSVTTVWDLPHPGATWNQGDPRNQP